MDLAGQEAGQVRPEDAKRAQQLQARRLAEGTIQIGEGVAPR